MDLGPTLEGKGVLPVTDVAVFGTQGSHDAAIVATTHVRIHRWHNPVGVLRGYGRIAWAAAQQPVRPRRGLKGYMKDESIESKVGGEFGRFI